jgi:electron transport complex protein RnfE
MMGLGFTIVLIILGTLRELIGQGTLFSGMDLLFGEAAKDWQLSVFSDYPDFLFAILPPGAFVGMGILIALKNIIDAQLKAREQKNSIEVVTGSKRVRTTGTIS